MTVNLRPARSLDAGATGEILHGFARENDWMPDLHSKAETIAFCGRMIDLGWVTVAMQQDKVVGFLALNEAEIHSLYLAIPARGQGIGRQLLDHAKSKRSELSLFAFQANHPARRFYERNGFAEVARSDGADNDENLPDIKYIWKREAERDG
ncbi:Ribosomal protein S18 acetylase RimI [Ruegeria halocynthiae]|uniref:Ribosomal protein S18 acetylase RimI n=1 Tax=Ruegeria halocynthiae TaxID=985054 RepID=A0A1H2VWR5_9RHOB|nr:GNAT family N-acetyltransferase [Ruegeria halocynthiae]SDW72780.1 Ribosomal protein S18 acetylase RimI [Ruegeria halocynthiae]